MDAKITLKNVEALADLAYMTEERLAERYGQENKRRERELLELLAQATDEVFEDKSGELMFAALANIAGFIGVVEEPDQDAVSIPHEIDYDDDYSFDELLRIQKVLEGLDRKKLRIFLLRAHFGWSYEEISRDVQTKALRTLRTAVKEIGSEIALRADGSPIGSCTSVDKRKMSWALIADYADTDAKAAAGIDDYVAHEESCDTCFTQHVVVTRAITLAAALLPPRADELRAKSPPVQLQLGEGQLGEGVGDPVEHELQQRERAALEITFDEDAPLENVQLEDAPLESEQSEDAPIGAPQLEAAQPQEDLVEEIDFSESQPIAPTAELQSLQAENAQAESAQSQNVLFLDVLDDSTPSPSEGDDDHDVDYVDAALLIEEQDDEDEEVDRHIKELVEIDLRRRTQQKNSGVADALVIDGAAEALAPDFVKAKEVFHELLEKQTQPEQEEPSSEQAGEEKTAQAPGEPAEMPEVVVAAPAQQEEGEGEDESEPVDAEPVDAEPVDAEQVDDWGADLEFDFHTESNRQDERIEQHELIEQDEPIEEEAAIEHDDSIEHEAPKKPVALPMSVREARRDYQANDQASGQSSESNLPATLAEIADLQLKRNAKQIADERGAEGETSDTQAPESQPPISQASPHVHLTLVDDDENPRSDAQPQLAPAAASSKQAEPSKSDKNRRRALLAAACLLICMLLASLGAGVFDTTPNPTAPAQAEVQKQPQKKKPKKKKRAKKKVKKQTPAAPAPQPATTYQAPAPAPAPEPAPEATPSDGSAEFLPEMRG